jgi:hypothetical protein
LEKVGQGQIWGYPTWLLSSWKLHLKKQIIPFQELLHKVTTEVALNNNHSLIISKPIYWKLPNVRRTIRMVSLRKFHDPIKMEFAVLFLHVIYVTDP